MVVVAPGAAAEMRCGGPASSWERHVGAARSLVSGVLCGVGRGDISACGVILTIKLDFNRGDGDRGALEEVLLPPLPPH